MARGQTFLSGHLLGEGLGDWCAPLSTTADSGLARLVQGLTDPGLWAEEETPSALHRNHVIRHF